MAIRSITRADPCQIVESTPVTPSSNSRTAPTSGYPSSVTRLRPEQPSANLDVTQGKRTTTEGTDVELEGDSPAPRAPAAPAQVPAQNIHVTPENVVALASMFRDCVDILEPVAAMADVELHVRAPWMGDPVSEWAARQFNDYFVDGENSFAGVLTTEYQQHKDMMTALLATARKYGLTDELAAAGFPDQGSTT